MLLSTLLMALREIRRNTLRSALTTLGIVIGVAAVIAIVTLGQGATARITGEIASMGVNMIIISPGFQRRQGTNVGATALTLDDARAMQHEIPTLTGVAPSSSRPGLVVYGNLNWNTMITGITGSYLQVRSLHVQKGREFSEAELQNGTAVCLIGETVRREVFGYQDPLGATIRVGRVACEVVGVMEIKGRSTFGTDQDDFLLIPLITYQRRISGNADIGAIFVSVESESLTNKAKTQVELLMRERRHVPLNAPDDFSVQDMREIIKTVQSVTGVLTTLLAAVAAVSLLVGGIGIMNIMLVSVTERTREIGIRLSIGARGREVLLQFLVEAIVLSMFGGVVGMIVGLVGSYAAGNALGLPFRILPQVVAIAFGFSVTVGVAFGFFPARKASRLNPIEALRHE